MPLTVITAEEQAAGIASMDAELKFLLEEKKLLGCDCFIRTLRVDGHNDGGAY